jgi:hypothetical protein
MHIVTYATHEERYLPLLKQSCPDLVVLGMGKKWNGFEDKVWAIMDYCKEHPQDIICFVDGFDSIVLTSPQEILTTYESFQTPLVMSNASVASNVTTKYIQDKLFGTCKGDRLNSGMFIGTAEAILSFWGDFQGGDDQTYATQTCRTTDLKIDTSHRLFYNYSPTDTIEVKHNRLYVNDVATCVISGPACSNLNSYLSQLGYSPPDIQYNWKYRIQSYMTTFLPEIAMVCITAGLLMTCTFPLSLVLSFLLVSTFLEYELNVKHYHLSTFYTFLYLCLDCIHTGIIFTVMYLLFNLHCSLKKLMILNIIYLIIVLCFYYHKRCVLSIYQNKIINKQVSWTGPIDRIVYFFKTEKPYIKSKKWTTQDWIDGNKLTCILIIVLNVYCLFKMRTKF